MRWLTGLCLIICFLSFNVTASETGHSNPADAAVEQGEVERPALQVIDSIPSSTPNSTPLTKQTDPSLRSGPDSDYVVRIVGGLVAIVALILVLAWLTRKLGSGVFVPSKDMKVISSMVMGQRERIALIEVGDKQLLVGVTAHQITALHTFDEPVINKADDDNVIDFKSRLQQYMARS